MTETKIPAIPPSDYEGSICDWEVALISRGLLKQGASYCDVEITEEQYNEILGECEQ